VAKRIALALLLMLALASVSPAPAAWADGDPASDVLTTQTLFLPQDAVLPVKEQVQLAGLIGEAAHSGYPIRVALIASATDLGSITELWRQPQNYAMFLGQELSFVYTGPLLVVMPDGFGVYHVPTAGRAALAHAPTGQGLGIDALTAIRSLAAAAGHPLALPASGGSAGAGAGGSSTTPWIALIAGALVIAAAWTASLRARPLGLR
jgi:hypothetical protein